LEIVVEIIQRQDLLWSVVRQGNELAKLVDEASQVFTKGGDTSQILDERANVELRLRKY
jgi:hypothetical protein